MQFRDNCTKFNFGFQFQSCVWNNIVYYIIIQVGEVNHLESYITWVHNLLSISPAKQYSPHSIAQSPHCVLWLHVTARLHLCLDPADLQTMYQYWILCRERHTSCSFHVPGHPLSNSTRALNGIEMLSALPNCRSSCKALVWSAKT